MRKLLCILQVVLLEPLFDEGRAILGEEIVVLEKILEGLGSNEALVRGI